MAAADRTRHTGGQLDLGSEAHSEAVRRSALLAQVFDIRVFTPAALGSTAKSLTCLLSAMAHQMNLECGSAEALQRFNDS
eukprot:14956621-Alexandrium_andersonii.AAC.1